MGFKGNIYAQHDSPISLQDTLFLDSGYIEFMEQPSKGSTLERLRQIKDGVLLHMDYQIHEGISLDNQSSYLEQAEKGLTVEGKANPLETHLACPPEILEPINCLNLYTKKSQIQKNDHVNNIYTVKNKTKHHVNNIYMDAKNGKTAPERDSSRVNICTANECSSSDNIIKTTGNRRFPNNKNNNNKTTTTGNLRFPKELQKSKRMQDYAITQLEKFGVLKDDQQYVLDWLTDRIKAGKNGTDKIVSNPIGFLGWIAKNHVQGTLPPSSYGIHETKENKPQKPVINKKQDIEAWARNLENMGIEVDRETQTIIKNKKVKLST